MHRSEANIRFALACSGLVGLSFGLMGCSVEVGEPSETRPIEPVADESAAIESATDKPAAAALQVRGPTGGPTPWIFACDSNHQLRRIMGEEWTPGFGSWGTIDTNCNDVPAAAKWVVGNTDAVAIYMRSGGGNLWEAWWPDATNAPNTFQWANISQITGFGHIAGAPVLVETNDADGHVSVAVRSESSNELYTMDWYNGVWRARKVINLQGFAIVTTNQVTARGQSVTSTGLNYQTIIAGRGLTPTDDSTGWLAARRTGFYGESYTRLATLIPPFKTGTITPKALLGTPFPTTLPEFVPDHDGSVVANFENGLEYLVGFRMNPPFLGAWQPYLGIEATGSPRGATKVGIATDYRNFFVRGRPTGQGSGNDLMWCAPCVSKGGNLSSAPTMFEYATSARLRQSAVYKDTNNSLRYFDSLNNNHVNLNLTPLP